MNSLSVTKTQTRRTKRIQMEEDYPTNRKMADNRGLDQEVVRSWIGALLRQT